MSLCDTCRDPGACCRAFTFCRQFPYGMPRVEVQKWLSEGGDPTGSGSDCCPVPFEAIIPCKFFGDEGATSPQTVHWLVSCPRIDDDGRCSDYETRPQVCRKFEPKAGSLCCEFEGPWDDILKPYAKEN